jgi:hypothetical protein
MILYVNGDSHSAAAEAVNVHAFANDDPKLWMMGRAPHPENVKVAWGTQLARIAKLNLHLDAESASSNMRIIRTTEDWLSKRKDYSNVVVVIQWSTWEREEWLIDGEYYQVNASGIDIVPESAQTRYKEYVAGVDWQQKTEEAHNTIWAWHRDLINRGIEHFFFNGNTTFASIGDRKDWGSSYLDPYGDLTFDSYIKSQGIHTVMPGSYHYGSDGHLAWAKFLGKELVARNLI